MPELRQRFGMPRMFGVETAFRRQPQHSRSAVAAKAFDFDFLPARQIEPQCVYLLQSIEPVSHGANQGITLIGEIMIRLRQHELA